ncbi:type II toxin-antitoxin system death-on-curing family toxin [soil metagenome]
MTSPVFLELLDVLEIHQNLVDLYGGQAGVRDLSLLQSALAMPLAGLDGAYFHSDLYEMAAAYLFHLIKNHPFIDGNKRTALGCALVFLDLNDIEINADEEGLYQMTIASADGRLDKPAIAKFFRESPVK